ncbi:putative ribonuclease H-like domain-containing protein [Tanacetum coccineum]
MKNMYCLVVTYDFIRFSWVFFLASKDETSEILKTFITGIENLIDLKVKVIRCDNGTEFKNRIMNQFCKMKGIKREFSVARTPQQNGVAERKNKTLIEAARTMQADSKLPTHFWAEAVNTDCYVQNRVLVIKPHNKTPYELFLGRKIALSFIRPFGCPITILNTIDHLGSGPNWLFDIDALTKSMNYKPIVTGNQSNGNADPSFSSSLKDSPDAGFKPSWEEEKKDVEDPGNEDSEVTSTEEPRVNQEKNANVNNTNNINIVSSTVNAVGIKDNVVDKNIVYGCANDPNMPELEEIGIFRDAKDDNSGVNMNNSDTYFQMDANSAFLYRKIEEEVYVCQPPGFEDPDFSDSVYKVEKAIYGLHQAPRAWYETLSTYLLDNGFQRGKIDKTLFFKRDKSDTLSASKEEGRWDFVCQDKYVNEIFNKFGFSDVKTASTPIETHKTLLKDEKEKM